MCIRLFRSLSSCWLPPPPKSLDEYIAILEQDIENWMGFKQGSTFFVYSLKGGGGYWPEGNKNLVAMFIRGIALRAFDIIQLFEVVLQVMSSLTRLAKELFHR